MTAHVPRLSVSLDPQIAEARRRAKRRRNLIAAVVVAAAAAGLTLGLRGSNHPGGAPAGLVGRVSRWQGDNLRVMYPRNWHVTTRPLTGITQPVQRFAIYSGRRPRPMAAPRAKQVIGVVMEETAITPSDLLKEFPRRPTYFALRPPFSVEGFSGSWERSPSATIAGGSISLLVSAPAPNRSCKGCWPLSTRCASVPDARLGERPLA